jgi:hypothetical protein
MLQPTESLLEIDACSPHRYGLYQHGHYGLVDAFGLMPTNDIVQLQPIVPIVDRQHRADGKQIIVIWHKMIRPVTNELKIIRQ